MNAVSNYTCPNCKAKLLIRRRREAPKPREQAFCPHCMHPLPARDGPDTLGYEVVEAPAVFKLIDTKGELSGILRLRYGSGPDDPLPFILTLMPQHVAHALGQTLPIKLQDIQKYAQQNADRLKAIAQNAKDRGLTAEVLE